MSLQSAGPGPLPDNQPWLSIIVPALAADKELGRCIASIELALASAASHEIVLIVPTTQVADAQRAFPSVSVHADTRKGIYAAMNDGARVSTGRYLYFIGKDDILLPTATDALAVLVEHQPTALFCDVYWGDRGTYSGKPSRLQLLGRNVCHQGIIYSRAMFEKHGPYLSRMTLQADHLLNLKILWDRTMPKPLYLKRPLAWYSGSGFSVVRGSDPVFWRLYPTVMRRYVGHWAAAALLTYRVLRGVG
jgi:glycosyltransferase involved in cell wall biosynthesis